DPCSVLGCLGSNDLHLDEKGRPHQLRNDEQHGRRPCRAEKAIAYLRVGFDVVGTRAAPRAYVRVRTPAIKMSTRRLAARSPSSPRPMLANPASARSRSSGSMSRRMSPLATARSTSFAIACFTCAVDAEYRSDVPPTIELSTSCIPCFVAM